jgi:hypothetical protein
VTDLYAALVVGLGCHVHRSNKIDRAQLRRLTEERFDDTQGRTWRHIRGAYPQPPDGIAPTTATHTRLADVPGKDPIAVSASSETRILIESA